MRNGIFIASLNSKRLNEAILNGKKFHFNNEIDVVDVFVFDTFEVLNGIFFKNENANAQNAFIENIISNLENNFVMACIYKRNLIRFTKIKSKLKRYIALVYNEYYTNIVFESQCRNQIYQNLQPKLNNINIENNKSNLIELLLPFLVVEIALYLYIYDKGHYLKIFGLESEMGIIESIKTKKYPTFNKYLNYNIEFTKVLID
ncbi:MAG: hypothetical protein IPK88_07525 [Saprospiraceae bacterium]|nr:hypothetical protein [Candidatus Defluviibacterium haderslevense]